MHTLFEPHVDEPSVQRLTGESLTILLIIPIRSAVSRSWYWAVIFDTLLKIGDKSTDPSVSAYGHFSNSIVCSIVYVTYSPLTDIFELPSDRILFSERYTYSSVTSAYWINAPAGTDGNDPRTFMSTDSWSHTFRPSNFCNIISSSFVCSNRSDVVWFNLPPVIYYRNDK